MEFNQRMKDLREDNDKKQDEIAEIIGTSRVQYSKYERGIQELPMRHFVTLAKYYHVSLEYLLGLTNEYRQIEIINGNEVMTDKERKLLKQYRKYEHKDVIDKLLDI